jgi:hypothetical protein
MTLQKAFFGACLSAAADTAESMCSSFANLAINVGLLQLNSLELKTNMIRMI